MSKLRVHEIARELDKTNKEVMDFLKSKNIDVKSHMSSLEDDHVSMIRANLRKGNMAQPAQILQSRRRQQKRNQRKS